jgi:hypothetical protein
MHAASRRLGPEDVIVSLDLASVEQQAVVMTAGGKRLTRFRVPHSRKEIAELLRRTQPDHPTGR